MAIDIGRTSQAAFDRQVTNHICIAICFQALGEEKRKSWQSPWLPLQFCYTALIDVSILEIKQENGHMAEMMHLFFVSLMGLETQTSFLPVGGCPKGCWEARPSFIQWLLLSVHDGSRMQRAKA